MVNSTNSVLSRDLSTVFLDRDGVLNEKMPEGQYVTSWKDFRLLPGVVEAISRLNRSGVRVVVVSNQRGVALGLYAAADVEAIHTALQDLMKRNGAHVDGFYFCPHDKRICNCRKPLPGLFEQAVADFPQINAATSAMIGDSLSDIEFGRRLGMLTVLLDGASDNQQENSTIARELADLRFPSLAEAVSALLASRMFNS
jgi:D-glycero-D-manno-heptose 1,7-bisphosphate phosphatase